MFKTLFTLCFLFTMNAHAGTHGGGVVLTSTVTNRDDSDHVSQYAIGKILNAKVAAVAIGKWNQNQWIMEKYILDVSDVTNIEPFKNLLLRNDSSTKWHPIVIQADDLNFLELNALAIPISK